MGESIAEGTITRWLVKVGDPVARDAPLLEISTDKVDAEIPSPASGVLLQISRQGGETVPVNECVGLVGEAGEQPAAETASAEGSASDTVGATVAASGEAGSKAPRAAGGTMTLEDRLRRFSSPLVRNIAKKEGVDIGEITGTGIHGRVTKKDILAFLERRATAAPTPAATPAAVSAAAGQRPSGGFSVPAYHAGENVTLEPMSKIRQITAAHMVYSKATSVHVTTVFHIDMSRIAKLRQKCKAKFHRDVGSKLSFMPFIFRAVCNGLRQYPQLNAALDGTNIVYKKDINLGMAVAMDRGLIVPVIKHADQLSLAGLASAANDLADRARGKKLKPEEAQGGTFTITNPGVYGSLFGTPVINQPQVAILGIGTIEKRPVVITDSEGEDVLAIRSMTYLAITFDHRLIDGADADHFMNVVKDTLEQGSWEELSAYL
jgi:2-oxoglutarate dehydrogenase E2 component (dihydrolipoamide succinyltransferase)